MLSDVGGWGVSKCSERPIFMTRHHANNISLARNLPFDSDVRQRGHPSMIPLHCLWAKSNNRTRAQCEYDVTLFFLFV